MGSSGRIVFLTAILLAACSESGGGDEAPFGLEKRMQVKGLTFPTGLASPGPVDVVDAFPLLTFQEPVLLTHAGDGLGRVFVVERRGVIRVFPNDPAAATAVKFLDIHSKVLTSGERGLLGLAFDPDYETNGFFYVRYSTHTMTLGADHRDVLSRFLVSAGDPDLADPLSETVLLSFDQPFSNHHGGMIAFGPDGMLYLAIGDGGNQHDPLEHAQDLGSIFGKILRLTPDGGIPPDNPFVGQAGAREEIWAYGFRNPWRFSFDRVSGDLWCGDVGQNDIEEVDIVRKGENYGWDLYEGTKEHENPHNIPLSATTVPVRQYGHDKGRAVTGGYVYRGQDVPSLVGTYVYGDFVTSQIWSLVYDGQQAISNVTLATITNPASFGEDEEGELHVCSFDGHVYRFQEQAGGGGGQPPFPQLLSESGFFDDTAGLAATPGVVEYDVRVELWSGGARKRRWLALPGFADIDFPATEAGGFPVGTVLAKHFEIDTAPGVTRRLETRVLLRSVAGWEGYTYKWNPAGTDADLLAGSQTEVLTILDPSAPGGQYDLTWYYPSSADCLVCHTLAAGRVLGVRTRQLNASFPYPTVVDNQLRSWNHIGLFQWDIGPASAYGALPRLQDAASPVASRARAYLDANCAYCHRLGGPTPVSVDLRYGIPLAQMNAILVPPSAGDLGLLNPFIVAPGSKETSVLWERMRLLNSNRMPPLGTSLVHDEAVDVVGQWIDESP